MNILAFENTLDTFSVALFANGETAQFSAAQRSAAERAMLGVDFLLSHAGITLRDVDGYCMGTGPGSFTGMRVCLSIIKGLSAGVERPCVGVPSYRAVVEKYAPPQGSVAVIFDAKKDSVYGAVYQKTPAGIECAVPEALYALEDFLAKQCRSDQYFLGEASVFADRIRRVYPQAQIAPCVTAPEARYLLPSAVSAMQASGGVPASAIELLYIHPDTCTVTR